MYKNKIMLALLVVSISSIQAFAFSTFEKTVDSKSKELAIKAEMNNCMKTAESKAVIHSCLDKMNNSIQVASIKVNID
jgi:hypothetical protein